MVDVGVRTGNGHHVTRPVPIPVRRRRGMPSNRAVVGGLLVAASAVGLFAAYGAADDAPATSYVVVTGDVQPGERLGAADLALVAIDLPTAQRAVSFTDPDRLLGTVALARMKQGQLVQSSDVAEFQGAGEFAQISVAVEPGNAMNGDGRYLRGGERVAVIATFTDGGSPVTRTLTNEALVVEVLEGRDGLGTNGLITVVLAVRPSELEAIATANAAATITLARTTGLDG